jgi:hypothetical protein
MKRSCKTFTGALLILLLALPVLLYSLPNGSNTERNLSISGTLPGNNKDNPAEILKKKPKVKITPKPSSTPKVTAKPSATPKVTPKPTATPKVTPEPTATPTVTPKPTATPTVTPKPTESPITINPDLFNVDRMYVKPTVVFETPICIIAGDRVKYYTKINFSNGNYYSYQEPWRGGKIFEITDARSWSYTKYESFFVEDIFISPDVKVTFGNRILYVTAYGVGKVSFELPPVSNATCK